MRLAAIAGAIGLVLGLVVLGLMGRSGPGESAEEDVSAEAVRTPSEEESLPSGVTSADWRIIDNPAGGAYPEPVQPAPYSVPLPGAYYPEPRMGSRPDYGVSAAPTSAGSAPVTSPRPDTGSPMSAGTQPAPGASVGATAVPSPESPSQAPGTPAAPEGGATATTPSPAAPAEPAPPATPAGGASPPPVAEPSPTEPAPAGNPEG